MQQDHSSFWTDIKTLEGKLSRSPDSFCFARLSEIYLKVGLIDDAIHTARQGIAKYPGFLGGQRALAMACLAKGANDECLSALKLVTEGMPEDQEAQKLMGRLLVESGEQDAARRAFKTVLDFFPEDAQSLKDLESIEFSHGSTHRLPYPDEEDDDEIIEDLEILEEIDVLEEEEYEEEQEASGLSGQEQLFEAEEEPYQDPLSTVTLADLYVKQGFIDKALAIYRSILADDPCNSDVSTRIAELEQQDNIAVDFAPAGDGSFEYQSEEEQIRDLEADAMLLGNVFESVPESSDLSEMEPQDKVFSSASAEGISAKLTPQGTADNAIFVLEGWLENIKRVKLCR